MDDAHICFPLDSRQVLVLRTDADNLNPHKGDANVYFFKEVDPSVSKTVGKPIQVSPVALVASLFCRHLHFQFAWNWEFDAMHSPPKPFLNNWGVNRVSWTGRGPYMGRANQQTTLCRCRPVCLNTLSSSIRILQAFSFRDLRGRFCIGAGL